jgi:hypothetical protein
MADEVCWVAIVMVATFLPLLWGFYVSRMDW